MADNAPAPPSSPDPPAAPASSDSPAPRRKKSLLRRLLKIALFSLGGLVLLIIIVILLLPLILTESRLKSIIAAQGSAALNGRAVSVGSVELAMWSGHLHLTDFVIANPEGFTKADFVRIKDTDARIRLWPAIFSFGKKVHVTVTVADPYLLLERDPAGRLNIADLLKPKENKEAKPLSFSELSVAFKVTGGRVTLLDRTPGAERETKIENLTVDANLPDIASPVAYKVRADIAKGSVALEGAPVLFHNGALDPDKLRGELARITATDLPADPFLAFAGMPPALRSLSGSLTVLAPEPGRIAVQGEFAGLTNFDNTAFKGAITADVNMTSLDAAARITADARPVGALTVNLDVADAGAKRFLALVDFRCDLARIASGDFAKFLHLPPTPDGTPAIAQGAASGKLEIKGRTTDALTVTGSMDLTNLQPAASLTGGTLVPPDSATFTGDARIAFTADRKLKEITIPSLRAKAAFLDAEITDGRIASLTELKALSADLSGRAAFSGAAFSAKVGKAFGLPELHDKLAANFSLKGQAGKALFKADGKLEREKGAPDPIEFLASAQLDASGDKVNVPECSASFTAPGGGATARFSGKALDLAGARNIDFTFDGSADFAPLAARFADYAPVLTELKPQGTAALASGKLAGSVQKFTVSFDLRASGLALAGTSPKLPQIPKELSDILAKETFTGNCQIAADLPKRQIEIKTFRVDSAQMNASIHGTITDYAAMQGSLDLTARAKTDLIGPVLKTMNFTAQLIDTAGTAEFAAQLDTASRQATLSALALNTAYLDCKLKDKCVISGLDLAKIKADPAAAARNLSLNAVVEGALKLDSLAKLPAGLLPPDLAAAGSIPFSLEARQASDLTITLRADATAAALKFADLFDKPAGKRAAFVAVASLPKSGGIAVPSVELLADGAEARLVAELNDKFDTLSIRSMTASLSDPAALVALVPKLKDLKPAGRAEMSATATVPIKDLLAKRFDTLRYEARFTVHDVGGTYAAMPGLALKSNGSIAATQAGVDGQGLVVTLTALPSKYDAVFTVDRFAVRSGVKGATCLLADPNSLALELAVSSPDVNATNLMAALPKPAEPATTTTTAITPAKPMNFGFLQKHSASIQGRIDRLTYDKHVVTKIDARLALRDNHLVSTQPIHAEVHGGTVDTTLDADLNDPLIAHSGTVRAVGIDMNSVASAAMSMTDVLLGRVGGDFAWKGKGFSPKDITTSWTADASAALDAGTVQNFGRFPLASGIAAPLIQYLGPAVFPGGKYQFAKTDFKFRLDRGKLLTQGLLLKGINDLQIDVQTGALGADGSITGAIAVKPSAELLTNYISKLVKLPAAQRIVQAAIEKERPPFCTFNLSGPWNRPTVTPDLAAFPKWVLNAAGKSLTDPASLIDTFLKPKEPAPPKEPKDPKKKKNN